MLLRLVIISLFTIQELFGQNLVLNPSFECGVDQCDFTILSDQFVNFVCDWEAPTNGTSDIFSMLLNNKACWAYLPTSESTDQMNPPIGSQVPRNGKRFAGIFTYNKARCCPNDTSQYREYLMATLFQPLEPGKIYCGEMYVSVAEQPKYATNNLGMFFSYDRINFHVVAPIKRNPQINDSNVITNNQGWTKVSGAFKANSAARYVTIGNFYNDSETILVDKGGQFPGSYSYLGSYYFIDDVSVVELRDTAFAFTGPTTICAGKFTDINAGWNGDRIKWTNLSDPGQTWTSKRLKTNPIETTSYRITGEACNMEFVDTITVTVLPNPGVELGNDTTICAGQPLTLDAGIGYASYTWQDNSTAQFFTVTTSGSYAITAQHSNGCVSNDNVQVKVNDLPKVDLGRDTTVCADYFPLTAGESGLEYQWSTGSSEPTIIPSQPGVYWVRVSNECGESKDSVQLTSFEDIFIPNVVTLNDDALNGKFCVKGLSPGITGDVKIFNRWGTEVFSKNNYKDTWPAEDTNIPAGIYFYELNYHRCKRYQGILHVLK